MKLWATGSIQSLKTLEEVTKYVSRMFQNLTGLLNNNVTFTDNMKCQIVDFYFAASYTPYEISHTLGVTPIGAVAIKNEKQAIVNWVNSGAWNTRSIWLQSDVSATTVRLLIIGA